MQKFIRQGFSDCRCDQNWSQETFAVKVILLLQASFWSFLFAKENFQAKNNEQNVRKEASFTFMQHFPPGGSKKSQTRKNSNKS